MRSYLMQLDADNNNRRAAKLVSPRPLMITSEYFYVHNCPPAEDEMLAALRLKCKRDDRFASNCNVTYVRCRLKIRITR